MLTVYVPMPAYMRQWLRSRFGCPARFPAGSYENAILARHLTRPPRGAAPQLPSPLAAPVAAPSVRGKPAATHNYLPRRGMALLAASVSTLFTLDLWGGCVCLLASESAAIGEGLEEWCRSRSITPENREAVRQRFYRLRLSYARRGVILGKRYRKKE